MINSKKYSVGIYVRLSKDDERDGESASIEHQKLILTKYADEQANWDVKEIFSDDGYSGTNFDRPSFQRMLQAAKDGEINLILVKDLSRFGRNYIEVGQFTDYIFPAIGCRFVALNDNVDTITNDNDIMVYKNLFNEFQSRDTSKKVRTIRKLCAERGQFMGPHAPFGYKRSKQDGHKLVIDMETAPTVRMIFELRCAGKGFMAIASTLNEAKLISPLEYHYAQLGTPCPIKSCGVWSATSVKRLLENEVYIGNMVQGKSGTISYKNRKLISKPQEDWIRIEDTHEAIIDSETWERVVEIGVKKHNPRKTVDDIDNMFSGLLKCGICGTGMRYLARPRTDKSGVGYKEISYICGNYARSGKSACKPHTIQQKILAEMVRGDIVKNARLISWNERAVTDAIIKSKSSESKVSLSAYTRDLKSCTARLAELEKIVASLYEDKVKGNVPEAVFRSLIEKYERERIEKGDAQKTLQGKIANSEQEWSDVSKWANRIKKYGDLTEVDATILWELIDHIEIDDATGIGKSRVCNIKIYYKFVQMIDLSALATEVAYDRAV